MKGNDLEETGETVQRQTRLLLEEDLLVEDGLGHS